MIGRIQIKPHDIAHFLHKERIAGQLEALAAVRLDGKGPEHSMHRGFWKSVGLGCLPGGRSNGFLPVACSSTYAEAEEPPSHRKPNGDDPAGVHRKDHSSAAR